LFFLLNIGSLDNSKKIEEMIDKQFSKLKYVKYNNTKYLNGYKLGKYPKNSPWYLKTPSFLIEVNKENRNLKIGRFKLDDFTQHLPKRYPKYLALEKKLIIKLEMLIEDLERNGFNVNEFEIMSGFRGPWYNKKVGGAKYSTHMYGLAVDILVGDVNRDGKKDIEDAKIVYKFLDKIDKTKKELVGGAAIYEETKFHEEFIHMDVRGYYARWGKFAKKD